MVRLLIALLLLPGLASAQTGGPDDFGMVYGPTTYDFVPLAGVGDEHVFTTQDPVRDYLFLPWTFPFYMRLMDTIRIGADGEISFDNSNSTGDNACELATNNIAIAAFWDDLSPHVSGGVYSWHDTVNDRFIVSWEDVPHEPAIGAVSFQVHLYPDGSVEMHWADTFFGHGQFDDALSATVGISDDDTNTTFEMVLGCDTTQALEGTAIEFTVCPDDDGDGYFDAGCGGEDCLDSDATVNPDGVEVCNGLDDDCDPAIDEDVDGDGDLETMCQGDCDDTDASVFSTSPELCDGLDQDCDGLLDEEFDLDADGVATCGPDTIPGNADDDCDDNDPLIYPGAPELCDGSDNSCSPMDTVYEWPVTTPWSWGDTNGWRRFMWRISVDEPILVTKLALELDIPGGTPLEWHLYEHFSNNNFTYLQSASSTGLGGEGLVLQESPPLQWSLGVGEWGFTLIVPVLEGETAGRDPMPNGDATPWGTYVLGASLKSTNPEPVPSLGLAPNASNWSHQIIITTGMEDDGDGDGFLACEECEDGDATVNPGADELCDGFDTNCDGEMDPLELDEDGDGSLLCDPVPDCNDQEALSYPGAPEACNEADDDCDGIIPATEFDIDLDGWIACEDCDDNNPEQNPGEIEICDLLDTDCDGALGDESTWGCQSNLSNDLHTDYHSGQQLLITNDETLDHFEVNVNWSSGDLQWAVYRTQDSSSNAIWEQVWTGTTTPSGSGWRSSPDIGIVMEAGYYYAFLVGWDTGMNTFIECSQVGWNIPPFASWGASVEGAGGDLIAAGDFDLGGGRGIRTRITVQGEQDDDGDGDVDCVDCDDDDPLVGPTLPEICDGIDNDCDDEVDEGFDDQDTDGDGASDCGEDCAPNDPTVYPGATEACNGVDDDCDGDVDEGFDTDGDGIDTCGPDGVLGNADDDCDDTDGEVYPGAPEGCNGIDNDCSGAANADEFDGDGDGFIACDECDDTNADVNPDAAEICNEIDDDCDGFLSSTETTDADNDGSVACMDCDDQDADRTPGAPELCDGVDNDCDGDLLADEGDEDGDGFFACDDDCDDDDGSIHPAAGEACDGVDNNCDDVIDVFDGDGDGYDVCEDDCDDTDASIHPGADEGCNGIDNDCDGLIDGEHDFDGDGSLGCEDCDDDNADVSPDLTELCDGLDNDCDGAPAEGEVDSDGDGYLACAECDDSDPDVFPGGEEICDGLDSNCDGVTPADEVDEDGDGQRLCDDDCDDNDPDTWDGAPELCDGIDNDCDGDVADENADTDGDLVTPCAGDCDDTDATINPSAEEVCDGKDGDCDGQLPFDELDEDGDGYFECGGDCDEERADVNPAALENTEALCTDDVDNDCDGDWDGADSECSEWDDGDDGDGGNTREGCGCTTSGGSAGWGLLLLPLLLRRRLR